MTTLLLPVYLRIKDVRKTRPSLNDVAKMAGVSKSTASRVINNKLGNGFSVREEVRQQVLNAAKQLNYRPNIFAQSLTKHRTRMIHVVGGQDALSDLGNIYQTIINEATKVLASGSEPFDVTVDMLHTAPDTSELPSWKIDGAIILSLCSPVTMTELTQGQIPYVVVNGPCERTGSSVVPDDIEGTKLAVKHLVELGHKRIAYTGPRTVHMVGHSSIKDRHGTYLSELDKFGLTPIEGHDQILHSAHNFLETAVVKNKATAVITYGHMEGLNIMQAAHDMQISIPEDLSLISFCDEVASAVMSSKLTFIDLRSREMGKIAAELLLEQIESHSKAEPQFIKVTEHLIVRNSTAQLKV